MPQKLPTFQDIRREVYTLLGDAQDWARSDWAEGTGPTEKQGAAFLEARRLIGEAKVALNLAAN